jgi:predicted aspartyl protease
MHGMVHGLQATITVMMRTPSGQEAEIEFVIDTGFEGALTMPLIRSQRSVCRSSRK